MKEAIDDPLLEKYQVIILDEVHERSLVADALLGYLNIVLKKRPDLKLVVMGATLEVDKFQSYFDGAAIVEAPGRFNPVQIVYMQDPIEDYIEAAILIVLQIHLSEPPGGILVFLMGEDEIEYVCQEITRRV